MYEMGKEEIQAVAKVLQSRDLFRYHGANSGICDRFEKALAAKIGVKHALATSSGTASLACALAGMGVGPGDEVIVPAYTYVSTALAPLMVGAVPVLAEVDDSLTLDLADVAKKITRYTKVLLPVHMLGLPTNMPGIMRLARKHQLRVLEDACQAVGGSFGKKRLGAIGEAGAFSFNYFKVLSAGEGGAVLTSDRSIYERAMIYHDSSSMYFSDAAAAARTPYFCGNEFRISEISGAILEVQLTRLDGILKRLRERKAAMAAVLAKAGVRLSPVNDPGECATTLCVQLETPQAAQDFLKRNTPHLGMFCPRHSGRHTYDNWDMILSQRTFHPKMNPWKWAHRKITYTRDMCPRTLEILARTVAIGVPYSLTLAQTKAVAKKLV